MLHLVSTSDSYNVPREQIGISIKAHVNPFLHRGFTLGTTTTHNMDSIPQRRSEHLPRQTTRAGVGTRRGFEMAVPATTMSVTRSVNEKDLLHGLNGRLAGFIDKVHRLEQHNKLLEREIEEIRGKAQSVSSLEERYGPELRRLRQLVRDITQQKHQIEIDHYNLDEELSVLRNRHEKEAKGRSEAESKVVVLRRDMDDAYQAKLQLDKKVKLLVDEVQCLKQSHEAEVSDMIGYIQNTGDAFQEREFGSSSVTAALRDIRSQLESHVGRDAQQVEETFTSQFAKLTQAAETKRECLRTSQQEINEYRRQLQTKNIELESAKGTREALEMQLCEAEDRHHQDILHYQDTIKQLENELINCKFDMSGYLREYQDLLNVKMALDVEILSYRKLLCGEEARLSSVSDSQVVSLPYIYHQSPVYPLPRGNRAGGARRRPEPQYKFVEEIITETTREIVLSEFEDADETLDMRDQPWSKRGSDKEENHYSQDGGEECTEQEPDSQQDDLDEDDTNEKIKSQNGTEDDGSESAQPEISEDKEHHLKEHALGQSKMSSDETQR